MSDSTACSECQTTTLQASLHTCEPCGTSCQQMAESQAKEERGVGYTQQDSFSPRTTAVSRRHSADGTIGSGSGSPPARGLVDGERFHPYRRQFRDGAVTAAGCLQTCSSSLSCLQEAFSPDTSSQSSGSEAPPPWDQYNGSTQVTQSSYPELPAGPVEPSCFLSHSYPPYSSSSSLQPVSSRLYSNSDPSNSSLQSLSSPRHQESTTQTLFPKPIYSYSILIFMALKSSKTGSLPVSEIYSFMTEHFPYFKTAPDGWKNSVRHNLSLNKCFEKVESKIGNSSRKGCLWTLNPAKVGKMQEELHKWRRKDPITVRRSMARPEDLDRLVGERPDKLRSVPPYTSSSLLSSVNPFYNTASSPRSPAQPRPPCPPILHSQYAHMLPQQPCYLPPTTAHPTNSFALCSPCGQQPAAGLQTAPGGLDSPVAAKMPPGFNSVLQAEYCVGPRSMQDLLLDGDAVYDADTFNPALSDLQLQGSIWEELKETSLVSDRHITTAPLSDTLVLQHPLMQTSCLQAMPPVRQTSEVTAVGPCEEDVRDEETGPGQHVEQHSCLNGLQPVAYSSVENLAGYLTSCATSISLM